MEKKISELTPGAAFVAGVQVPGSIGAGTFKFTGQQILDFALAGVELGGDTDGPLNNTTIVGLRGLPIGLEAPTTGQALVWDGFKWAPANVVSSPGGSSGQVQFNNAGAFAGSANLFFDLVNGRLGIGTNAPTRRLTVAGDANVTGRLLTSATGIGGPNGNEVIRLLDAGTSRRLNISNDTDGIAQFVVGGTAGTNNHYIHASSVRLLPDSDYTGPISFILYANAAQESSVILGNPLATNVTGRAAVDFEARATGGGRSDAGQITFRQEYNTAPGVGLRIYPRIGLEQTTGSYTNVLFENSVTVASGDANITTVAINGAVNQSGSASGFYKSLVINPTLTSMLGAYTAFEIVPNIGIAINQTGASATNRFAGSTIVGANTAPAARLHVVGAGNTSATWTAQFHSSGGINNALMIRNDGNVGFGTNAPTDKIDINGENGYQQLRLRTPYTPTSSSDANGNTGDVAWDSNYIYIRVGSGWKRSALSTF